MTIYVNMETITPAIAKSLLSSMGTNRRVTQSNVSFLAKQISASAWELNGETLKIDANGRLLDGQHRCLAVIQTGIPIQTLVARGASGFATIDTGASRRGTDVLSIAGHKNVNIMAGVLKVIVAWEEGRLGIDAFMGSTKIPNAEYLSAAARHPHLDSFIAMAIGTPPPTGIPSGILFSVCYLSGLVNNDTGKAIEFMRQVSSGENIGRGDPAWMVRDRMMRGSVRAYAIPRHTKAAFIIKAINAHQRGEKMKLLRWTSAEDFPQISHA